MDYKPVLEENGTPRYYKNGTLLAINNGKYLAVDSQVHYIYYNFYFFQFIENNLVWAKCHEEKNANGVTLVITSIERIEERQVSSIQHVVENKNVSQLPIEEDAQIPPTINTEEASEEGNVIFNFEINEKLIFCFS